MSNDDDNAKLKAQLEAMAKTIAETSGRKAKDVLNEYSEKSDPKKSNHIKNLYGVSTELLENNPLDHVNIYNTHRYASWLNQDTLTGGRVYDSNMKDGLPFRQYKDGKHPVDNEFGYHGMFTIMQAMDVYGTYTSSEPAFGHFRAFLFIMGYSGKFNLPVDVFGMGPALGLQQSTISRILGILGSFTPEEIKESEIDAQQEKEIEQLNYETAERHARQMQQVEGTYVPPIRERRRVLNKRPTIRHGLIQPADPRETKDVSIHTHNPTIRSDGPVVHTEVGYGGEGGMFMQGNFRQEAPTADGRRKYVNLTPRGMELAQKLNEVITYDYQDPTRNKG